MSRREPQTRRDEARRGSLSRMELFRATPPEINTCSLRLVNKLTDAASVCVCASSAVLQKSDTSRCRVSLGTFPFHAESGQHTGGERSWERRANFYQTSSLLIAFLLPPLTGFI